MLDFFGVWYEDFETKYDKYSIKLFYTVFDRIFNNLKLYYNLT